MCGEGVEQSPEESTMKFLCKHKKPKIEYEHCLVALQDVGSYHIKGWSLVTENPNITYLLDTVKEMRKPKAKSL